MAAWNGEGTKHESLAVVSRRGRTGIIVVHATLFFSIRLPVVYRWTEAHAVAGHAGAMTPGDGCLRCGLDRTGVPHVQVAAWPDEQAVAFEEPACGAHYQPYGPIELGFVTSLVAQLALDCLLGKVTRPCLGFMPRGVLRSPKRAAVGPTSGSIDNPLNDTAATGKGGRGVV